MADDDFRNDPALSSDNERSESPERDDSPRERVRPGRQAGDGPDRGEEQLWVGGYSSKAMAGAWLLAALVSFVLLGLTIFGFTSGMPWLVPVCLGAILVLWLWLGSVYFYRRMSVQYELTSQRFLHREGILSRRTERIEVIDMDDITCNQGIVQRMFGVGTIKIVSSDRTHPEIYLKGIDDANRVADLLDEARRKERRKRALHIESV